VGNAERPRQQMTDDSNVFHLKTQKTCDRAEVPLYILLEANEHFDEFEIYENSLHINSINEPVAKCTDNIQDFLDNFGFLDDLAPFNEKKYVQSFEYDDDSTLVGRPNRNHISPVLFRFGHICWERIKLFRPLPFRRRVL
jgi:hypothetical protein